MGTLVLEVAPPFMVQVFEIMVIAFFRMLYRIVIFFRDTSSNLRDVESQLDTTQDSTMEEGDEQLDTGPEGDDSISVSASDTPRSQTPVHVPEVRMPLTKGSKRHITTSTQAVLSFLKQRQYSKEKNMSPVDPIETFFLSMAQSVKKLPDHLQCMVKMSVCRIVTDAELLAAQQALPQHLQQPISQQQLSDRNPPHPYQYMNYPIRPQLHYQPLPHQQLNQPLPHQLPNQPLTDQQPNLPLPHQLPAHQLSLQNPPHSPQHYVQTPHPLYSSPCRTPRHLHTCPWRIPHPRHSYRCSIV